MAFFESQRRTSNFNYVPAVEFNSIMTKATPLLRFLRAFTVEEQKAIAIASGTTRGYLYQLAGNVNPNPRLRLAMNLVVQSKIWGPKAMAKLLTLEDLLVGTEADPFPQIALAPSAPVAPPSRPRSALPGGRESGAVERAVERVLATGESVLSASRAEGCNPASIHRGLRRRNVSTLDLATGERHVAGKDARTSTRKAKT